MQKDFLKFVFATVIFSAALVSGSDNPTFVKDVTLKSGDPVIKVPTGRIWKIEGLKPYQSERGIGTADLYVDGQVIFGEDNDFITNGKFDVVIGKIQSSPIWVLEGASLEVGDSRHTLTIKEYATGEGRSTNR